MIQYSAFKCFVLMIVHKEYCCMLITLLCIVLPALLSCALSLLLRRERKPDLPALAVSFCMDALFILCITTAVMVPLDRAGIDFLLDFLPVPLMGKSALIFSLALGLLLGLVHVFLPWQRSTQAFVSASRRPHLLAFLLVLAFCALSWGLHSYPFVSVDVIWFYLCMPLQGTSNTFWMDIVLKVILPAMALYALGRLLLHLLSARRSARPLQFRCGTHLSLSLHPVRASRALRRLVFLLYLLTMLSVAFDYLEGPSFIDSFIHAPTLFEDNYVDPRSVAITFPERKRNLIWLCIESAETTPQDTASGGVLERNLIPEMTQLAQQNVSFSQSDLIQGAAVAPGCSWTIAGIVAQTSGLPLKLTNNSFMTVTDYFSVFLPGATTLGDILQQEGYRNVFMAGSDFTFGGRRQYVADHGDYEVWDLLTARELGLVDEDYAIGWGLQDYELYAFAREKLTELASGDQPFNLNLLTVDTHDPHNPCPLCADIPGDDPTKVTSCSSRQAADFVAWCQQQPFYENTTIVITGDHACMSNYFYSDHKELYTDKYLGGTNRLVYNAFINAAAEPVRQKNRLFCTLDFFPSMLASLGAEIEGERLGLGTNLFSDAETLCERYGYDDFFTELNKKSNFYNTHIFYP